MTSEKPRTLLQWELWFNDMLSRSPSDGMTEHHRRVEECAIEVFDAIRAGAEAEREQNCRAVCPECGGRSPQYFRCVEGPDEAGNFVHLKIVPRELAVSILCRASAIRARKEKP